ncbi:HdeD family acid-resistance protein [Hydrogenimonas sp.]
MRLAAFLFDNETLRKFSNHTIVAGVIMALIGLVGVIAPQLMSLVAVNFLAWLFLFSAGVQGYAVYRSYRRSFSAWLKPFLSLVAALLLLFFPLEGVAAVGILLASYLLIDAFSSFSFGWEYRPNRGWWILMLNGALSLLLALILLAGWPYSSLVLVGLFVGISLFFDGVALVTIGIGAKRALSEDESRERREESK